MLEDWLKSYNFKELYDEFTKRSWASRRRRLFHR
jgi:hypothetical protein